MTATKHICDNPVFLNCLINKATQINELNQRLKAVSYSLLSRPYKTNPLIGSKNIPEQFIASLDYFDCVTFCETVLALTINPNNFLTTLKQLRYKHGTIDWLKRNHYMSLWLKENEAIIEIPSVLNQANIRRSLSSLANYPIFDTTIQYCPLESLSFDSLPDTAMLLFVSLRENLDYFHLGFLIKKDNKIYLRHAAKSLGSVQDELLKDFLARNTLIGVTISVLKKHINFL